MGSNDLNQKYTIEKYCSKIDIAKALGTNLIEPIWREIIEFRKHYEVELPLFDASRAKFFFSYIDSVQTKTREINDCVSSYIAEYSKLNKGTIAHFTFSRDMLILALKNIAKFNNIDCSEITLGKIVEDQEVDEIYTPLVRYKKALMVLQSSTYGNIDDEFLGDSYAILKGVDELTSFYRENDIVTQSSKLLFDKDYDGGVPANDIEEMMSALIDYINNFDLSLASRLTSIFFIFNYVKPFDSHNMELACLLAKRVLASTDIDTGSIYIPIEEFVNNKEFFGDINKEVKKTHDFTYAILFGSDLLHSSFNEATTRISEVHAHDLDVEAKLGPDPKQIEKEFGIKPQKPANIKSVETKKDIERRLEQKAPKVSQVGITKRDLKNKAEEILESDPLISKKQAYFYVHHSTVGKYYSIQQFVKFVGCVYETARTSMDNLAKLGYYRREQIKNKFVYTPINKE